MMTHEHQADDKEININAPLDKGSSINHESLPALPAKLSGLRARLAAELRVELIRTQFGQDDESAVGVVRVIGTSFLKLSS